MIFKYVKYLDDCVDARRDIVLGDNNSKEEGPFIGYFGGFIIVKHISPLLTLGLDAPTDLLIRPQSETEEFGIKDVDVKKTIISNVPFKVEHGYS